MRLPNVERAVVEDATVRDYLLSPEHPVGWANARFFTALGFTRAVSFTGRPGGRPGS